MSANVPLSRWPTQGWRALDPADIDRQYNARASVPSFEAELAKFVAASQPVLNDPRRIVDLVYDALSGQTLDLYIARKGAPLFVWIHGGYWRALSKTDNAFAAAGMLAHGINVAVIDYALAPAVTLDEIVRQVRAAIGWLHRHGPSHGCDTGRIHIGGSSAGGQLLGMLLTGGWHDKFGVPEDAIGAALAISGLHDVEPLLGTHINGWMNLDVAAAQRNSPLRHIPARTGATLLATVGGDESPEFQRQTAEYAEAFAAAGHVTRTIAMPGHNHFSIALAMAEPNGVLCQATLEAMARQG